MSYTYAPTTGVVVTGGASGIGLASARALVEVGRPVALWDLQADAAEQAAKELGGTSIGIGVDVTDGSAVEDALARTREALPSIGGLVHAAGRVITEPVGDIDFANFSAVLDVNLTAHARLVQLLLPDLEAQEGSAIVGIASIEAIIGHAAIPAYCSSKAGLVGLTRSLAAHLGPKGIRVNAVCPGYIDTPMLAPALAMQEFRDHLVSNTLLGRIGRPEDIGKAVRFLLSDDASYITGSAMVVDGGVTTVD
jgi:NAD(P)-dependent dehydrogenase (short-subunit alcohol dehydrogenase family)